VYHLEAPFFFFLSFRKLWVDVIAHESEGLIMLGRSRHSVGCRYYASFPHAALPVHAVPEQQPQPTPRAAQPCAAPCPALPPGAVCWGVRLGAVMGGRVASPASGQEHGAWRGSGGSQMCPHCESSRHVTEPCGDAPRHPPIQPSPPRGESAPGRKA